MMRVALLLAEWLCSVARKSAAEGAAGGRSRNTTADSLEFSSKPSNGMRASRREGLRKPFECYSPGRRFTTATIIDCAARWPLFGFISRRR